MQHAIRKHLSASDLEVIVVLEGIDPHTSNTFQARQSYTAADIVFDEMFVPSLSVGRDGQATFDWSAFHACSACLQPEASNLWCALMSGANRNHEPIRSRTFLSTSREERIAGSASPLALLRSLYSVSRRIFRLFF